jgi:hypothetical protein
MVVVVAEAVGRAARDEEEVDAQCVDILDCNVVVDEIIASSLLLFLCGMGGCFRVFVFLCLCCFDGTMGRKKAHHRSQKYALQETGV